MTRVFLRHTRKYEGTPPILNQRVLTSASGHAARAHEAATTAYPLHSITSPPKEDPAPRRNVW